MLQTFPTVIGHRGACHYAPENTLASLHKASELGTKWVEFDVMLTHDEEAIIFHDETLNRTTTGKGKVANTDYAVIAKLDAGSWFAAEFHDQKVPTFVAWLENAAALGLGINVEIKPTQGKDKETAQKTVAILHQYWPKTAPPPLVSSFSVLALQEARSLDADLSLALIISRWIPHWQELLQDLGCVSLHVRQNLLTPAKVQEIKAVVPHILAYTVNDAERAAELFAMGVTAVFSDVPDRINTFL